MNTNLIEAGKSAWLADDGQSTERDIASSVLRQAVERGELPANHGLSSALESALVAFSSSRMPASHAAEQARVAAAARVADEARAAAAARSAELAAELAAELRAPGVEIRNEVLRAGEYAGSQSYATWRRAYRNGESTPFAEMWLMSDDAPKWERCGVKAIVEQVDRNPEPTGPTQADDEAAQFVAALPSMTAEQAKAAYWGLSKAARLSSHIRALPKSLRRQF